MPKSAVCSCSYYRTKTRAIIIHLEHRQKLKGLSCWQLKVTNCNWLQVRETHLVSKWTEWPASLGSHWTLLHKNEASQTIVMEMESKLCLKPNEN